jgi:hypothetical protein
VARRTAETAPKGAIVIEIPFGAKTWSNFPNIAIAANAPAEGQRTSLREGAAGRFPGFQSSQNGAGAATLLDDATTPCSALLLLPLLLIILLPSVWLKPRRLSKTSALFRTKWVLNSDEIAGEIERNDVDDVGGINELFWWIWQQLVLNCMPISQISLSLSLSTFHLFLVAGYDPIQSQPQERFQCLWCVWCQRWAFGESKGHIGYKCWINYKWLKR